MDIEFLICQDFPSSPKKFGCPKVVTWDKNCYDCWDKEQNLRDSPGILSFGTQVPGTKIFWTSSPVPCSFLVQMDENHYNMDPFVELFLILSLKFLFGPNNLMTIFFYLDLFYSTSGSEFYKNQDQIQFCINFSVPI